MVMIVGLLSTFEISAFYHANEVKGVFSRSSNIGDVIKVLGPSEYRYFDGDAVNNGWVYNGILYKYDVIVEDYGGNLKWVDGKRSNRIYMWISKMYSSESLYYINK